MECGGLTIKMNSTSFIRARKHTMKIAFALIVLGVLVTACGSSANDGLAVDGPAPSFTLQSSSGEEISLSEYQGKQPVLLYFHMAMG
jgi:hypothetical protein